MSGGGKRSASGSGSAQPPQLSTGTLSRRGIGNFMTHYRRAYRAHTARKPALAPCRTIPRGFSRAGMRRRAWQRAAGARRYPSTCMTTYPCTCIFTYPCTRISVHVIHVFVHVYKVCTGPVIKPAANRPRSTLIRQWRGVATAWLRARGPVKRFPVRIPSEQG